MTYGITAARETGAHRILPRSGKRWKRLPGKAGGKYSKNCGIAMETQHYPDSPNKPMFPSTLVKPGIPLYSMTEYRFRAE